MSIYVTLDGEVLDLSRLTVSEAEFFDLCYGTWRENNTGRYARLQSLIFGDDNPILKAGRRVTRETFEHPLFQAVTDLEARAGVLEGKLLPDREDERPGDDPLAEEFVSIAEAARIKGITVPAVHAAIRRGDLVALANRPLKVSVTSLGHWEVDAGRQRSARKAVVLS